MVSTDSGLFVFDTPNVDSLQPITQPTMPVWEYRFNEKDTVLTPLVNVIRGAPQAHLDGCVVVWTGDKLVTLTPCSGLEGYRIDSYKHNNIRAATAFGEGDISPGRMFWIGQQRKTILTCSLLFGESCDDGFMRLGNTPVRPGRIGKAMKTIALEETMTSAFPLSADVPKIDRYKASVECISWDEESGRLCVLLGSDAARIFDGECPKEIVVIDFV
jgi:hypothetical protein